MLHMVNDSNNNFKLETFDVDKIADLIFLNLIKEVKPYNKTYGDQAKHRNELIDSYSTFYNRSIEIANNISLNLYYNYNTLYKALSPFSIRIFCNNVKIYGASFSKFKDKIDPTKEEFAACINKAKKQSLNKVNKEEQTILYELVKIKKIKIKVRKYIFEAK